MAHKGTICWIIFVGMIFAYASSVFSIDQEKEVKLLLFDAFEKKPLDEVIVSTRILDKSTNKILTITEYAADNEIILVLPHDTDLSITVDVPSTEGKDFFLRLESKDLNTTETVYLLPVSTLDLVVVDSLENRVPHARVSIQCEKEYGIEYGDQTDKYGSFTSLLPVGTCTVHAEKESKAGSKTIQVQQGETARVKIKLRDSFSLAAILVVLAGMMAGMWFVLKRARSRSPAKAGTGRGEQERDKAMTSRISTILQTLNERERQVVEYLLENEGKSTQARIRHATHIPKTSLARILETLKRKNVLNYESNGMLKKVELTPWFLQKEE